MKKYLFFTLLFILACSTVNSQEYKTSLGLRAGLPYGFTVKHFLSEQHALEGILASSYGGFIATGLYENEHWTGSYPGLNWYWGIGAHAGFWDVGANKFLPSTYDGSILGVDGVAGLEYTFDQVPINLSLDILPSFNLIRHFGWNGINGALSIRYVLSANHPVRHSSSR